jgi:hypothetical protein
MKCSHCKDTGIEPGTIVISPGSGMGFNSLDPDPLDRGSYVPCTKYCGTIPSQFTTTEKEIDHTTN